MTIKRITAIVPVQMLKPLEKHLRACGVPGVTVEHVKGYGEHPNYFRRDLMQANARVVLYAEADDVETIVAAVIRCATEAGTQAGILAVEAIERLVHLPSGTDASVSLNT
jgi:nitrogen regulatory protein P-II 1